jgi:hypothetical protein
LLGSANVFLTPFNRSPVASRHQLTRVVGLMPPRTNRTTVCVCVSNLSNETSEADIRALFSQYAAVRGVRLFSGEPYRKSRGFGYLDLLCDGIDRVVSALDGYVLNGLSLRVSLMSWTRPACRESGDRSAEKKQRQDNETPKSHLRPRYAVASVEKPRCQPVAKVSTGIAMCSRAERPGLRDFTAAR